MMPTGIERVEYDDHGWCMEWSYYGTDGLPCCCTYGEHKIEYKYDEHGNKIEEIRYDAAGNMIRAE